MKSIVSIFLVLVSAAVVVCGESPTISGFKLGMTKEQAFQTGDSLVKAFGAEAINDSNTFILHAADKHLSKEFAVVSVKCMFNKKKTVQALNFTCRADNSFAVEALVNALEGLIGKYDGKRVAAGYTTELTWDKNKSYKAYLFSSESARETYILLSTPSFMKEEDIRGGYKE